MDNIGNRIKTRRKELSLTLRELHEMTGLSIGNLSDIENNKYAPSVSSLAPLSQVLERSIDWIVIGSNYKSQDPPSFSAIECDIVSMFRELDDRDKEDIFDYTKMKYDKTVKKGGARSLYSTYKNEEDKTKINPREGDSGIV